VLCDRIGISKPDFPFFLVGLMLNIPAEWVVAATTFLAIPWWFVATISKSLVLFVACVAMLCRSSYSFGASSELRYHQTAFWISAFIAAAVAECANFSQTNPGVGCKLISCFKSLDFRANRVRRCTCLWSSATRGINRERYRSYTWRIGL
jgi:hypothetical protein